MNHYERHNTVHSNAGTTLNYVSIKDFAEQNHLPYEEVLHHFGTSLYNLNGIAYIDRTDAEQKRKLQKAIEIVTAKAHKSVVPSSGSAVSAEVNSSNEVVVLGFSALCKDTAGEFLANNFDSFSTRRGVYVSSKMFNQLTKMAECDAFLENERQNWKKVIDVLEQLKDAGKLFYFENDSGAHEERKSMPEYKEIISFIRNHINKYDITVVIDDRMLHKSILKDYKYLRKFKKDETKSLLIANIDEGVSVKNVLRFPSAFCSLENQIKAKEDDTIPLVTDPPKTGDTVYDSQNIAYHLGDLLSANGGKEGLIYTVPDMPDKLIKIFRPQANTELKIKKLQMLCDRNQTLVNSRPSVSRRIAFPEKVLFNSKNQPIGYIMPYFKNVKEFAQYTNRQLVKGNIGISTKFEQVRMAKSLCEAVEYLHCHEMILADINAGNILFNDQKETFIVDIDSAQLTDELYYYPSKNGRDEYLAPERQKEGRDRASRFDFRHTKSDDVWILQTIIYKVLTGGFEAYSNTDDFMNGNYRFQKSADDNIADCSDEQYMRISHLPVYIISAFWNSFSKDGENYTPDSPDENPNHRRLAAYHWSQLMRKYYASLVYYKKRSPVSVTIAPQVAANSCTPAADNPTHCIKLH